MKKLTESEHDYTANSTTPLTTNASNNQTGLPKIDTISLMKSLESVIVRKRNKI